MNTQDVAPIDADPDSGEELELLAFRLNDQEYCVDIMSVCEIRSWTKATPLPHAPKFVRGVINLRGTVLPIIDLARRLNTTEIQKTSRDVIIVVENDKMTAGLLVSAVSDILSIHKSCIQAPPEVGSGEEERFVSSLAIFEKRLVRILDLNSILQMQQYESIY